MKKIFKGFFCMIVTICMMFVVNRIMLQIYENVDNYDYSNIYEINGTIINTGWDENKAFLDVELTNETEVRVYVDTTLNYNVGEEITVFTNNNKFSISKQGIAFSESIQIFLSLAGLMSIGIILFTWWKFFKWKGIILSCFLMCILFCC